MMDYGFKNSTLLNSNAKQNNNSMSNYRQVLYINSFNKLVQRTIYTWAKPSLIN